MSVLLLASLAMTSCGRSSGETNLWSLDPAEILDKLDLSGPGLEAASLAAAVGNREDALRCLLEHYRKRFPLPDMPKNPGQEALEEADQLVNHVFQWGPYDPADYGAEIDWGWDPRGDIEWVAAVYRFYWASALASAYLDTRDEKYAKTFVDLTSDWISKHPLENHEKTHPVYTNWRGFAWLDIQTGIRATKICTVFPFLVHAESFTPDFLGVLLASLYDHQIKTEMLPMNKVHNKAIFEQRGVVNIAFNFPEFKDSERWLELAMERTTENLLAQTTSDGVQKEWSGAYHRGVLRDAVEIMERMESRGISVSEGYRDRVRKMYGYIYAISTPDLAFPMFGDCSRKPLKSQERSTWEHYGVLLEASRLFGDPKYEALAKLDRKNLPEEKCFAFPDAGMYVFRDRWDPEQVYFALHCSPPAISGHDQPDNGTFELCAFGRWLMPDTGYYTYGHDPEGRAWHRQTSVHQTLTLDGKDSEVDGRLLMWDDSEDLGTLVVENPSYESLTHRRTVWFVDNSFFVLLDEAIGAATGTHDLHFQLAPGDCTFDPKRNLAMTGFDDANVLILAASGSPVMLEEEEGWHAWEYGKRTKRPAFRFRHADSAPVSFLTLVVPYRGKEPPAVSAAIAEGYEAGCDRVSLDIKAFGKEWTIGRDLARLEAWRRKQP
jgi:heparan-sulfate lyase